MVVLMLALSACQNSGDTNKETGKKVDKEAYQNAVANLEKTELKLDGSNEMSEDILIALNNAEFTEPKNIIMMIGDGMGFNIVEAGQIVYSDQLYENTLAMNYLPVQSAQSTYSATTNITDSAAGGTALATGFKTMNKKVGMDAMAMTSYKNVLELAAEKGKSTGVVVTVPVTDATPATFTTHVSTREEYEKIAAQQLEKLTDGTLDLLMGGGRKYYEGTANSAALASAIKSGLNYATDWETASQSSLPLVGLYAEDTLDTTADSTPSIAEMTACALDLLEEDEDGFFLMVEGGQIDDYAEFNDFDNEVREMYEFDCAVAVVMRYIAMNPDTVLIITADHETGGLGSAAEETIENIDQYTYTTKKHTYKTVPVKAVGYRTEELNGIIENVDIAAFVASLLGEEDFGMASTRHTLLDTSKKANIELLVEANKSIATAGDKAVEVSFSSDAEFVIPLDKISKVQSSVDFVRVFHMTVKNSSDKTMELPTMKLTLDGDEYIVEPQEDYIDAGETIILSYTFPYEAWGQDKLESISELVFTIDGAESTIELSNMKLTERKGSK